MIRLTCYFLIALLLAVLAQPVQVQGAEDGEILLRYRFEPEQVIRYQVSLHDDYLINVSGVEERPYSHQDSVKSYRVLKVHEDGSADLELQIEWVSIEIEQNDEKYAYDSRKDKSPELVFQGIAALVGKPHLRLTISNVGEVTATRSLNGVELNAQEIAGDVLVKLPEKPVKLGSSWTEDVIVPLALPGGSQLKQQVKLQRRYLVQALTDNQARISVKTRVLTPLDDPDLELQLIRRQPNGTIDLDLQRGLLVKRALEQDNQVVNFGNGASQMQFKQVHTEVLLSTPIAQQPPASLR